METSAKTGANVKELFKQIVEVLPIEPSSTNNNIVKQYQTPLTIEPTPKKKNSKCC